VTKHPASSTPRPGGAEAPFVTLAYTTLNQMKNWAITVQGAIIAAVAAFNKANPAAATDSSQSALAFPVAIGSVLAYVFTLRLFVRAILCYNNLQRWNTLQTSILELELLPRDPKPNKPLLAVDERRQMVRQNIQDYYYRWRSPLDRARQIASNLKLGFGILIAMPPILLTWSASITWDNYLVRALVAFALGATAIEAEDFFPSPFFDTADRQERQNHDIFPAAGSDGAYILRWILIAIISSVVALWPWISVIVWGAGPLPTPIAGALYP